MTNKYVYLLKDPIILNLSTELIKKFYTQIFYTNLMDDVFIDYEKVLNHKYGNTKKYTLNIINVIDNFNNYLSNQNAGIEYLSEDRLNVLIMSFNIERDITTLAIVQAKNLMNDMLIKWYSTNKAIFIYPINGSDFIDKDEKDMINIISKSYIVYDI
jgi:hypothetical protein